MEEIDAVDNGIEQYDGGIMRYGCWVCCAGVLLASLSLHVVDLRLFTIICLLFKW